MTPEKLAAHKRHCANMLTQAGTKHTTVKGKAMIFAYWYGVINETDNPPAPYVQICLMSGRFDELVDFTEET